MHKVFTIVYENKIPHAVIVSAVYLNGHIVPGWYEYTLEFRKDAVKYFDYPEFMGRVELDRKLGVRFITLNKEEERCFLNMRDKYIRQFEHVEEGTLFLPREEGLRYDRRGA